MSNGASTPIDFSQTLAAFLASAVSDGTWDDVIEALKVDQSAAQATDITENMKIAAARAIASAVSSDDLAPDLVIPTAFDRTVVPAVSRAVAEAAAGDGVLRS